MCVHAHIHVHSHTRLEHGAGLNTVVAVKPWHSPSDMFKSVLITDSPLNLHLITSVCHIKKRREEWHYVCPYYYLILEVKTLEFNWKNRESASAGLSGAGGVVGT